jgi:hypothetical protein
MMVFTAKSLNLEVDVFLDKLKGEIAKLSTKAEASD